MLALLVGVRFGAALQRSTAPRFRASRTVLRGESLTTGATAAIRAAGATKRREPLRMPARLSPTAASTFLDCEQLFLFRNLWRLPEPPSPALVRGSLAHSVLEHVWDAPREERTTDAMERDFRERWRRQRAGYLGGDPPLFETLDAEREWGLGSFALFANYVAFEDPSARDRGPAAVEEWCEGELAGAGVRVVGKLDRLDADDATGALTIVDYKTGAAPSSKSYLRNAADLEDRALFQLRIYAWMLERSGRPVESLRLLYLGGGAATPVDERVPAGADDRAAYFAGVEADLGAVWARLDALVEGGDPLAFASCDRKWCFCHVARPLALEADGGDEAADTAAAGGTHGNGNYSALTVADLKDRLRDRGLRVSGKKTDLVDRLVASDATLGAAAAP